MADDPRPRCLYCGARYDTPLPLDCPGCGQHLGSTMSPDTTLADLVKIAGRSGRTVLVHVAPGIVPDVAAIVLDLGDPDPDPRGWCGYLRHDGTEPTDADMEALEALLDTPATIPERVTVAADVAVELDPLEPRVLDANRANFFIWASALSIAIESTHGFNRAHLAVLLTRMLELAETSTPTPPAAPEQE